MGNQIRVSTSAASQWQELREGQSASRSENLLAVSALLERLRSAGPEALPEVEAVKLEEPISEFDQAYVALVGGFAIKFLMAPDNGEILLLSIKDVEMGSDAPEHDASAA